MVEIIENKFLELLRKPKKTEEEVSELEYVRELLDSKLKEEIFPLSTELNKYLSINDIWDLVNTSQNYKDAIPTLINHLSKPYHPRNKEGIVRALAVKEAKGMACKSIIEEYHKAPKDNSGYRWAFGNTMAVTMTEEYIDDVIAIVRDESNGESRHMFVAALGNTKSPRVKATLQELLNESDEAIAKEARKALKKIK